MSGFSVLTAPFLTLTAGVGILWAGTWNDGPTTGRLTGDEPDAVDTDPAVVGRPATVAGLRLILSDLKPGGADVADSGPDEAGTVELNARSENPTGRDGFNPDVAVFCTDGRRGGWYALSRWEPGADLPAKTFMEGRLVLGVPTGCTDPEVRAADWQSFGNIDAPWRLPLDTLSARPTRKE